MRDMILYLAEIRHFYLARLRHYYLALTKFDVDNSPYVK